LKSTGVIRRVDDLGRIVLPKELRRTMRIKEGESLEIYTEGEGKIILQKYMHTNALNSFVHEFTESMSNTNNKNIIITDTDKIISASGTFNTNLIGERLDKNILNFLTPQTKIIDKGNAAFLCEKYLLTNAIIKPINVFGDIVGLVIVESNKSVTDYEKRLAEFGGQFMSKYLEI
jgi:AbrB family transcriptional regulator (stage V sporulation protein T)